MDRDAFEQDIRAEGYDVLTRDLEPGVALDEHDHARDVKDLVPRGSLTIAAEGETRSHRPGEVFLPAAGVAHTEHAGPEGASLLLGRRAH